jgi:hypothetical protein
MQSFKQYVLETKSYAADHGQCEYHLTLSFATSVSPDALQSSAIKLAINEKLKKLGKFKLEMMFGTHGFVFYVKQEINQEIIQKIKDIVFTETGKNEKDVKFETVWINGFPWFKIQSKSVTLDCAPDNNDIQVETLKGIENFIECEKLNIVNSYLLKSTILGVFKIKGIKELSFEENTEDNLRPEFHPDNIDDDWIHIILDNFENGRNLSKAQTELFKSGYKELAKL